MIVVVMHFNCLKHSFFPASALFTSVIGTDMDFVCENNTEGFVRSRCYTSGKEEFQHRMANVSRCSAKYRLLNWMPSFSLHHTYLFHCQPDRSSQVGSNIRYEQRITKNGQPHTAYQMSVAERQHGILVFYYLKSNLMSRGYRNRHCCRSSHTVQDVN